MIGQGAKGGEGAEATILDVGDPPPGGFTKRFQLHTYSQSTNIIDHISALATLEPPLDQAMTHAFS